MYYIGGARGLSMGEHSLLPYSEKRLQHLYTLAYIATHLHSGEE